MARRYRFVFATGCWLALALCSALPRGFAQALEPDSATLARRQRWVTWGTVGAVSASYTALSVAWYSDQERTRFRWFNDGGEWQQIDKVGHAWGAYQQSRLLMELLRWSGASPQQVRWVGGLSGFVLQAPIEILDGFAADYGASGWDLLANATGSALAIANDVLWQEQRIQLKFSYLPTDYPAQRPDLLGNGLDELLKDYNGQTYWLTVPLSFRTTRWAHTRPLDWLGLAVGYGGRGMVGGYGTDPPAVISAREVREFYLGLDLDLTRIRTRSRVLRTVFTALNAIRLPLPALRYREGDWRFLPLAF